MTPTTSLETVASIAPNASPWAEVLRGGDRILIRPIRADDIDLERIFIEGLSIASRRFRFLESMSSPSPALLKQLTVLDPATDVAYVAVRDGDARDEIIGVGRFSAQAGSPNCEFALAVSDEWQNKGLATHLMHHLAEAARARGIARMYSSDARDNNLMRRFAAHLQLDHVRDPEDATQVVYSLRVSGS